MNSITRDDSRFSDDEIIEMARAVEAHDFDRIAPPPQVWNNVLAELEVAIASEEASARRRSQRWFSSPRLLSAAAAILLMVGIAVAVVASRTDDAPIERELATAVMTDDTLAIPTDETGQARVVCDDDGCFVEVELTSLELGAEEDEADLELWVINSDVSDMHSLGFVTGDQTRVMLPEGVDVDGFPIVDISIEPRDGEPTHSGLSVLRGLFEEV